jgi:PAS domain S-box-containing protein
MNIPRILIVEDEAITALELTRRLQRWGFEVVGDVASGQNALEIAEELKPDLIIMDINLKGKMDGIDTAKAICKIYDVPIIFLTAHGNENIISKAKSVKPAHYIIKPYRENELKFAVESGIENHKVFMELKKNELSYRAMAKNIPGIVYRTYLDEEFRVEFLNDFLKDITGYSPRDIRKIDLAVLGSLIIKEDLEKVLNVINESIKTGMPYEVSYYIKDHEGNVKLMEEKGRPTLNSINNVTSLEGVIFHAP